MKLGVHFFFFFLTALLTYKANPFPILPSSPPANGLECAFFMASPDFFRLTGTTSSLDSHYLLMLKVWSLFAFSMELSDLRFGELVILINFSVEIGLFKPTLAEVTRCDYLLLDDLLLLFFSKKIFDLPVTSKASCISEFSWSSVCGWEKLAPWVAILLGLDPSFSYTYSSFV